ncbi:hypothetical protein T484DRAFT_3610013 [Baffinella frigidus]|nr:hypothetical protein T484DRAFT_3610013 [Cryptophyta sp. CCMP2293]
MTLRPQTEGLGGLHLHPTPYTLNPTPHTLNPNLDISAAATPHSARTPQLRHRRRQKPRCLATSHADGPPRWAFPMRVPTRVGVGVSPAVAPNSAQASAQASGQPSAWE